jgi:hypothetical protein
VEFRPFANVVEVSSEWLKWLAFDAEYVWETAVNHDPAEEPVELAPFLTDATEIKAGVTLRPTPRLRFEQALTRAELRTRGGSARIATEHQLRTKIGYQFNRAFSLRAIVDYEIQEADTTLFDDEERQAQWGLDLLFTYLLHPGTALYFGYTTEYENLRTVGVFERDVVRTRSPGLQVGRQLFLKLNYLWRF